MKLQVYSNPTLLDFIKVCLQMPEDERKQIEAISGQPYDIDSIAAGNFTVLGPKWVFKDENDEPVVVGGFVPQRPGVWRDFMLTTPAAWEKHWYSVSRNCRRAMDAMLVSKQAHRLECIAHASRTKAFEWYRLLGYNKEAVLHGYNADGSDAVIFSRVKH